MIIISGDGDIDDDGCTCTYAQRCGSILRFKLCPVCEKWYDDLALSVKEKKRMESKVSSAAVLNDFLVSISR